MLMKSSQTLIRDKYTMNKELKELNKINNAKDSNSMVDITTSMISSAAVVASIMNQKKK